MLVFYTCLTLRGTRSICQSANTLDVLGNHGGNIDSLSIKKAGQYSTPLFLAHLKPMSD